MRYEALTKEESLEIEVRLLREAAERFGTQLELRAERVRAAYRRARAACEEETAWDSRH